MSLFELMADMFRPQETECLYECKMCHAYYPELNEGYCDTCWEFEQDEINKQEALNEQNPKE